jgi:signal transduction histidine kinase
VNAQSSRLNQIHLLLVESNPADARLIEIYLDESGFGNWVVDRASDMGDALSKLSQCEYTIVLLNLYLPDGVGLGNIRRIKSGYPHQNIIVLTGFDERVIGIEAIQEGAMDYLVKGDFDENSLAKTLRFSIERQNFIRRLEETQRVARVGSWEYWPDTGQLTVSGQLNALLGLSGEETNSATDPELQVLLTRIHRIVRKRTRVNLDTSIHHQTKGLRYYHVQARMMYSTNGRSYIQGILQDITERYQTEELRKSRDLARKSAEIREQFIASISHEMRTPINAIMGLSNLLLNDVVNEEQRNMVQSIRDTSDILLGVVNDILDYSAIQAGKIHFKQEVFSTRELCHNLERMLEGKIRDKGLHWSLNIDPTIPDRLTGDKLRLYQILLNLVGNAIKFTQAGEVGVHWTLVYMDEENVTISIQVKDTGIGIDPDLQETIFEDFNRGNQYASNQEGTGLGLAITRQLVLQQGGAIEVKSKPHKGSVFTVRLTYKLAEMTSLDSLALGQENTDDYPEFKGTLLLVEDHKMNQIVAGKTLSRKWPEARVIIAENGQVCLDILEKEIVQIILMDLHMPVMDGFEAIRQIRHHPRAEIARLPVIAMTANAFADHDQNLQKQGFNGVVLKPFEPAVLFRTILNLTMNQKLAQ